MCGLSVVADFAPGQNLAEQLLRMHDQVPHRGPDGEGFAFADEHGVLTCAATRHVLRAGALQRTPRVGIAFRWLKIQDPRDIAVQPVVSEDRLVCLIFNGEIYNFRALREELKEHGHVFRSEGDAEVLLASYLQWGTTMLPRLTGMWAFVLLDLRSRALLIARDRFGIKPLYYSRIGSRLLIGSEIKQLIAAGAPVRANIASVARFLRGYRPESPDETFFDGVFSQPAATVARIDLDSPADTPAFTAHWHLPERNGEQQLPIDRTADILEELLSASVNDHLSGPAPIGHLISGGLDSSVVAALAVKDYARRGQVGDGFSMVLPPGSAYDESTFIDHVSSHLGFHSHKAEFSASWLKANIGRISRAQEEPVAGPASAGQFLVFELAAENGMRVMLDGQGADEIFAGYLRHQLAFLRDCAARLSMGELLTEGMSIGLRNPRLVWRALNAFVGRRLIEKSAADSFSRSPLRPQRPATPSAAPRRFHDMLRGDLMHGNLRTVLALTDRNAMAHSIEARVPYIDHRVVEFAFRLPDRYKVGFGERKRILRKVAIRHLPGAIVHRRDRIGFGVPTREWLRRDFREELSSLPQTPFFRNSAIMKRAEIESFVTGFLSGDQSDAATAWRLFATHQWANAYSVAGI